MDGIEQATLPTSDGVSLRDQLSEAFDKADIESPVETTAPVTVKETKPATVAPAGTETQAQTEQRLRDEKGQFAKGKPEAVKPAASLPAEQTRPARPSSWKKDHWEAFDKIATDNPTLAAYINQRESEFAKGVSTYKQEYDQAKPLVDAIAPFMPLLQQYGIQPQTWIQNLGNAHRTLALGGPAEKLQAMARLAQDYGVPLQALTDAGAQQQFIGQQQRQQPQFQQQEPPLTRDAIAQEVRNQQIAIDAERSFAAFTADPKYPHLEVLQPTMVQLLEANLADDYPSAYEAALRHPRHADIYAGVQEQERTAQEAERRSAETAKAQQARARTVSTRTSTPSATTNGTAKGLSAQLSENFDAHLGGRV